MNRKFRLTLVRHGETEMNKLRILQGQFDEPLNETGKLQSIRLGKRISDQRYSHIFSSDLKRAQKTCELAMAQNDEYLKNHKDLTKMKLDARLRERRFGCLEGKPSSEMSKLAHHHRQAITSFTPEGGETPVAFRERASGFFRSLCKLVKDHMDAGIEASDDFDFNVLIVSHGGLIRMLFASFVEDFGCVFNGNHWTTCVSNASLSNFMVSLPLPDEGCGEFAHAQNGDDWINGVTVKCIRFNDTS